VNGVAFVDKNCISETIFQNAISISLTNIYTYTCTVGCITVTHDNAISQNESNRNQGHCGWPINDHAQCV